MRRRRAWPLILFGAGFLFCSESNPAAAFQLPESLQLSGNVESQTLIRHSNPTHFQLVQNRNVLRLHTEWDWQKEGQPTPAFSLPFASNVHLSLLYRGVYDSFYDINPGDRQRGQERTDDLVGGRVGNLSHSQRTDLKFDNDLREGFVDMTLRALPLSFRFGRQQVVWGESDHFRLMDLWNPLDVRWHMHQEAMWDEIRMPLWLLKGVYNIGTIGPLSDAYAELVYNPGDYQPGIRADYLPRPWALPFPDPTRQGQIQYDPVTKANFSPRIDLQGTSDHQGDFHRNPAEASEVGTRVYAKTPHGIEFTLNYFYGRGRNIGASLPVALRVESVNLPGLPGLGGVPIGKYQVDSNNPSDVRDVYPVDLKAKIVHPYLNVAGFTAKYYDAAFTNTSYRMETAYVFGSPFHTVESDKLVRTTLRGRDIPGLNLPTAPLGFTKRDVWSGMLGFDRAAMLESVNQEAPWIFSGQFFWTYTTGKFVDQLRGNAGTSEAPYFGNVGVWKQGQYAGRVERQQDARQVGNGDDIHRWEHLITLSATSFYRNSTIVPILANVFDPVNLNDSVLWSIDYFMTSNFIVTVKQSFYTDFGANVPSNDPWYVGGRLHRRDETGVKVTYQF